MSLHTSSGSQALPEFGESWALAVQGIFGEVLPWKRQNILILKFENMKFEYSDFMVYIII